MKKRILSLLLLAAMLVGVFPVAATYAAESGDAISLWCENAAAESVSMYRGGYVHLDAQVRSDLAGALQWQIAAGGDEWVDIQNASSATLRVSYGMVASVLDADNSARVRCVLTVGEDSYTSRAATIRVTDEAADTLTGTAAPEAPDPLPAPEGVVTETTTEATPAVEESVANESVEEPAADLPMVLSLGEDDVMPLADDSEDADEPQGTPMGMTAGKTYTITIRYVYGDSSQYSGQNVALPYIEQRAEDWTGTVTVTSPNCIGYTPDIAEFSREIGPLTENVEYTVYYSPATVSYSVRHYQQNVDNDEYTLVETTRVSGLTEQLTSDTAAQSYAGFTALSHYSDAIAADGSTSVDIYYDRNYYMLSFDLDGGYGTEPIYARYGAAIRVNDPTRAGYTFAGWNPAIAPAMPVGGNSHTALWSASDTSYKIAYWLQNADDDNYSYVGAVTVVADTGAVVSGAELTDDEAQNRFGKDWKYYTYNKEKTEKNVTVAGDNSTVVRVYYDRKEYTLRFYYARTDGANWQVATSTNGSSAQDASDPSSAGSGWKNATKPTLVSGYEETSVQIGSYYTYYYIDLTAKYGANLENIWPGAPFVADGDGYHAGSYKFVSWGTQYGSGYNTTHDNKNIKGIYSQMDDQLVIDSDKTKDQGVNHWLVGYWNATPNMYTYQIYYETMQGEEATKQYNGKDYTYKTEYTVGSTDKTLDGQSQLSFAGVECVGKESDDQSLENGSIIRFYYDRTQHTVTFYDGYKQDDATKIPVPYGGNLKAYLTDENGELPKPKSYPDALPKDGEGNDAYEFAGWYIDSERTIALELDDDDTMPDKDVLYYAHWKPRTYTVTVYDGQGSGTVLSTQAVLYNGFAEAPELGDRGDESFIGWFYTDASDAEHAFSFAATPVTQNLQVYAKWRSTETRMVTVRYVLEDGTEVAKTETQRLTVGQVRTYNAKTGSALYPDYQEGCFPTVASQSITPTGEEGENLTVTFEYVEYDAVPYWVKFYIEDDNGNRYPAYRKTDSGAEFVANWNDTYEEYVEAHEDNNKSVVTELYVPEAFSEVGGKLPDGYVPNTLQATLVVVPGENSPYNEDNTIVFVYKFKDGVARYSVEHYIQNSNDDNYTLYQHTEGEGAIGSVVSAQPITISGYEYSHKATEDNKDSNTLTSAETISGQIVVDHSLTLKLYYDAIEYPYQIMYLEKDTGVVLKPTKTESEAGVQLKARYGATVTTSAIEIEHYKVDESSKSIVIAQEAQNSDGTYTASQNTIYFYYTPISGGLEISKKVELDPTQAAEEGIDELPDSALTQEFTFTIAAAEGFHKSSYDYVVTGSGGSKTNGAVLVRDGVLTVTLHHGESIRIPELRLDTYTVTETYVSGFRTTVEKDSVKTIQQSATVTLDEENETETVNFVNQYPFYTGDLVVRKQTSRLDESDPYATGYYKVTVTLWPDQAAREKERVIEWQNAVGAPAGASTSLTIPAWVEGGTNQEEFSVEVYVPVGENGALGEVKMTGVPTGTVRVEEQAKTTGYITDYYRVAYDKAEHQNDEEHDRGAVVNTHVHGGHPTAVTFINTYKKSSLTIEKTVAQAYAYDSFQSGKFYFTVTGTTELPDGRYALDSTHTAVVTDGNVTIEGEIAIEIERDETGTSWSDSVTLNKLPAGYYTVTEAATAGFTCQSDNPSQTVLVSDDAAEVRFVNEFDRTTGSLTVSKTIEPTKTDGVSIDTAKEFTFVLEPTDGTLAGSYSTTNGQTLAVGQDGTITFVLRHGESITISGLPVGQYELRERTEAGYGSSFDAAPEDGDYTAEDVTISTNEQTIVRCVNRYPVNSGELIVSKTVVTPAGYSAIDQAPADDSFTFTVSLSGYASSVTPAEFVKAEFHDAEGDTMANHTAVRVQGSVLSFELAAGESVALTLPVCQFTVSETALVRTDSAAMLAEEYETSYMVNTLTGESGKTYALDAGKSVTAAFTNTYKRHYADLTINTKTALGEQNFIFDVKSEDGSVSLSVVLEGTDTITVRDLPVGKYIVTEQDKWSWREVELTGQTVTPADKGNTGYGTAVTLDDANVTVAFDYGAVDRTKWLSGYSYGVKGGG